MDELCVLKFGLDICIRHGGERRGNTRTSRCDVVVGDDEGYRRSRHGMNEEPDELCNAPQRPEFVSVCVSVCERKRERDGVEQVCVRDEEEATTTRRRSEEQRETKAREEWWRCASLSRDGC